MTQIMGTLCQRLRRLKDPLLKARGSVESVKRSGGKPSEASAARQRGLLTLFTEKKRSRLRRGGSHIVEAEEFRESQTVAKGRKCRTPAGKKKTKRKKGDAGGRRPHGESWRLAYATSDYQQRGV